MKVRLSSGKVNVRISEDELEELKLKRSLGELFYLSDAQSLTVVLNLLETSVESSFQSIESGFVLNISEKSFKSQKTKKDSAWEISVTEKLNISVEVDLKG